MLGGQPVVNLDNLDAPLCSSLLCQALERPRVQVRILGASQTIEVESRTTWFATGTNLRIVDDLTRRCLIARLDTGLERPELREFEEDPLDRIAADRGRYIFAALTIVQAYATAGMPGMLTPLASYRDWSDRVRSALVWIGAGDPCDSMPTLRENDPAWLERAAVYAAWPDYTKSFTAADLIRLSTPSEGNDSEGRQVFDSGDPDLREALAVVCDSPKGLNPKRLGEWLNRNADRVTDGRRLVKGDTNPRSRVRQWRIECNQKP
jgi:putative DNA primase/helicase